MASLTPDDSWALRNVTIRDLRRRPTTPEPSAQPAKPPPPGPSIFTLQRQGDLWLLTYPDGSTRSAFYKEALWLVKGLKSEHESEVKVLNHEGLIVDIIKVAPAPTKAVEVAPRRASPAAASASALRPSPPNSAQTRNLRLFIEPEPRHDPYKPWGDWKVRPWREDSLEVEAEVEISGEHLTAVCYLITDDRGQAVNAFAHMGGMLNSAWEHRQSLLASPLVREVMPPNNYLTRLLANSSFEDTGTGGVCSLDLLNTEAGRQSLLVWEDGETAPLDTTPHTRFLVHRTLHIAAGIIAELLILQQSLERGPILQAQAETKTVWEETDSALAWLDSNLTRVWNIMGFFRDLFDGS